LSADLAAIASRLREGSEAPRLAQRQAGLPFETVWAATFHQMPER